MRCLLFFPKLFASVFNKSMNAGCVSEDCISIYDKSHIKIDYQLELHRNSKKIFHVKFLLLARNSFSVPSTMDKIILQYLSIAFFAIFSSPLVSFSAFRNFLTCTILRSLKLSLGEYQYRSVDPFEAPFFLAKTFFTH